MPKRKRNIAAYHLYKALDKPTLMFLAEALKNSETKEEKRDAAGWEVSESLSWQFDPVVSADNPVLTVHIFLQDPQPQKYTTIPELSHFGRN